MKIKGFLPWFLPVFLVLLVFAVYCGALRNGFIFDDHTTVESSRLITSWRNLPKLVSGDYFRLSGEETYRPMATASYFGDYALYRGRPAGWHATNILLHAVNVLLVFYLLVVIAGNGRAAFFAAALYAVFPLNAEAVNAISYREDLLVVFFGLLSFLFYLRWSPPHPNPVLQKTLRSAASLTRPSCNTVLLIRRTCTPPGAREKNLKIPPHRGGRAWVGVIFLCFSALTWLFAMFSKENAVVMPLLFLAYEWIFPRPAPLRGRRLFFVAAAFILPVFIFAVARFVLLRNPAAQPVPFIGGGMGTALAGGPVVLMHYVRQCIVPFPLLAEYPPVIPSADPAYVFRCVFAWGLLLLFAAAVIYARRRNRLAAFGAAWFLLAFLPVSNLVPLFNHVADRYMYLPAVGLCMLIAGLLFPVSFPHALSGNPIGTETMDTRLPSAGMTSKDRCKNIVKCAVLCVIIILWGILSVVRTADWRSDETLWKKNLAYYPASARAWTNIGVYYVTKERYPAAFDCFSNALRVNPDYAEALYNRGLVYSGGGLYEKALGDFSRLLKADPDNADAYNDRGIAYAGLGLYDKAVADFSSAINVDPYCARAYRNRGITYSRMGQREKAAEDLRAAEVLGTAQ